MTKIFKILILPEWLDGAVIGCVVVSPVLVEAVASVCRALSWDLFVVADCRFLVGEVFLDCGGLLVFCELRRGRWDLVVRGLVCGGGEFVPSSCSWRERC